MALVPIRVDRTSRPPLGTPLRSDGHWSVQGLVGAWAFNEGAGQTCFDLLGKSDLAITGLSRTPNGLANSSTGQFAQAVASTKSQCPNDNTLTVVLTPLTGDSQLFWTDGFITLSRTYAVFPNQLYYIVNTAAGNWSAPSPVQLTNGLRTIVSVGYQRSGNFDILQNGVQVYSGAAYALGANYSGANSSVEVLRDSYGGNTASVELALLHNIYLTIAQRQSLSENPWQIYEPETIWINVGSAAATLDQYAFRFLSDNGSESMATFLDELNANITLTPGSSTRIRMGINATGDLAGKQFQLEYRRKPSGGSFGDWNKV